MNALLTGIGCGIGLFFCYVIIYTKTRDATNEPEPDKPEVPFSEFDTKPYNDEVYR